MMDPYTAINAHVPRVLTPTARTRRRGVSVACILEQEYLSRYGCVPSGTAWRPDATCSRSFCVR